MASLVPLGPRVFIVGFTTSGKKFVHMGRHHDKVSSFTAPVRRRRHDGKIITVADHRLDELRASLHGDDFDIEIVFLGKSSIFRGPNQV
jgi:hypothetical protein